jgi:hypothetical protein
MTPRKSASSRAMATTTWLACVPLAIKRRSLCTAALAPSIGLDIRLSQRVPLPIAEGTGPMDARRLAGPPTNANAITPPPTRPDPEVVEKAVRRRFTADCKLPLEPPRCRACRPSSGCASTELAFHDPIGTSPLNHHLSYPSGAQGHILPYTSPGVVGPILLTPRHSLGIAVCRRENDRLGGNSGKRFPHRCGP